MVDVPDTLAVKNKQEKNWSSTFNSVSNTSSICQTGELYHHEHEDMY